MNNTVKEYQAGATGAKLEKRNKFRAWVAEIKYLPVLSHETCNSTRNAANGLSGETIKKYIFIYTAFVKISIKKFILYKC